MGLRNTTSEFGSLAKSLHWLIAIGIFVLIYLGLEQAGMKPGPAKDGLRAVHGSIALVVLVLMTVRLIWRLMNEVPAHPDGAPAWQRVSATLVHWGIYVTVFIQLISGPITVATGGRSIPFFNLISFSLPVEENEDKHHFWEEIHEFAWKIIAALLLLHVLASLYNHFIVKNDVLRRMTVGFGRDR
jgi:cytochrome b561